MPTMDLTVNPRSSLKFNLNRMRRKLKVKQKTKVKDLKFSERELTSRKLSKKQDTTSINMIVPTKFQTRSFQQTSIGEM
jgi:hypothetical protein